MMVCHTNAVALRSEHDQHPGRRRTDGGGPGDRATPAGCRGVEVGCRRCGLLSRAFGAPIEQARLKRVSRRCPGGRGDRALARGSQRRERREHALGRRPPAGAVASIAARTFAPPPARSLDLPA
jgi:hypothetical protein